MHLLKKKKVANILIFFSINVSISQNIHEELPFDVAASCAATNISIIKPKDSTIYVLQNVVL
jgi:hypothetical protein